MEQRKLELNRPYKHFKGKIYYVHFLTENTETGEKEVVYQALYPPYIMSSRPYDMFMSEVDKEKYPNVEQKYRFELWEG